MQAFRFVICSAVALVIFGQTPSAQDTLGESNYRSWVNFIRPNADETKYLAIGWRSNFAAAIEDAKALQRPILFWTMNGHPLACT